MEEPWRERDDGEGKADPEVQGEVQKQMYYLRETRAAYIGKFEMCRICFRSLALRGELPGVIKSSW